MTVSFAKIQEEAPALINLAKLSRVELSKKGLENARAQVVFVMDHSGSMSQVYKSGAIQRLAEKVLAVATGLDDDGSIDFFVFDNGAAHLGVISLNDYIGAIDRLRAGRRLGSTDYAAAFYAVRDHFGYGPTGTTTVEPKKGLFGFKKPETAVTIQKPNDNLPADLPVFAVFLTDGAPNSKPAAVKALTEISHFPIFWKFLSIGKEDMEFLQKLDDLKDRFIDNADYQHIGDVDTISDKELFAKLLEEYPEWIQEAKAKGLLK